MVIVNRFSCRKVGLLLILAIFAGGLCAQNILTISGTVQNQETKAFLFGANITCPVSGRGTTSDLEGKWKISINQNDTIAIISHIGYRTDTLKIDRKDPKVLSGVRTLILPTYAVFLIPETTQIPIAQIVGQAETWKIRDLPTGQIRLSVNEISKIPSLFGEQDLLNSLHSLPGVQSVGEGSGYLHIRGGNADQNLILLDEAVIYNPSHLLGIFSVINPSAIQSLSLYKGGIPANYGDRLASVIELTTRDGSFTKFTGEVSVGLIASKILVEGPLVRNKVSMLLTLRRTQLDLITPFLLPKTSVLHGSGYSFADFNGKITWKTSDRGKVWLSAYSGSDDFLLKDIEYSLTDRMSWGNRVFSLNSWQVLSNRTEMRSSVNWSGYGLDFRQLYRDYDIRLNTGISNIKIKQELLVRPTPKQLFRMGLELQQYRFNPYQTNILSGTEALNIGDSIPYRAREGAIFLHHEWTPAHRFTLHSGVRLMYYQHRGPFDRFVNDAQGFPVDTIHHPIGKTLAEYIRVEPRISLSWQVLPGQMLKLSASRQYQPVHMVPVATTTLPLDLWIPSTELVAPQKGSSFSLGWFPDLEWAGLEGYADGFYRLFDNQVEFAEDQSLLGFVKDNLDRQLTIGKGKAYGFELFIRKKTGRTQGWIGYTWSESWRIFPGINNGKPFHPRHDRTHDVNLVLMHSFGKRWEGSLQFVYATGQPTTIPISVYVMNGTIVQNFSERNSIRLPDYHRVDVAMTRKPDERKKLQSTWTFSIYNMYNRLNPFFIYYDLKWDYEKNLLSTRTRQISLLPVLPSVTWTGRF
jgi:outer membrane receptor protein involved in Fe transport